MSYQSIDSFIARQPWPETDKNDAIAWLTQREMARLNPPTGSQVVAWAKARGLSVSFNTERGPCAVCGQPFGYCTNRDPHHVYTEAGES